MIKLPSLDCVRRMVRSANREWDGGEYVALTRCDDGTWRAEVCDHLAASGEQHGQEWIPGGDIQCDTTAVARRLLAAWRDALTG